MYLYPHDITQQEYKEILHAVLNIYRDCNVAAFPLDVGSILKHYGFRIYSYSTLRELNEEVFEICCSYTNDSFRWKDIIGYNEKAHSRRIAFSLMHELGHVVLKTKSETVCDAFASHILAPRILVHRYKCRNAEQIHDQFGLSYSASNITLSDYKAWYDHICFTTRKPLPIEQSLEAIFFPPQAEPKLKKPIRTKKKRLTKRQREMDERAAFFQELRLIYGEEYVFHMLEEQWLYGNNY
ncbi:ImmA/IrrE family metallo-endopeptidase [Enterocloster lavalensis]|uniref:ImmA/IrrE family metallo-endopeptidase n=1 Tax=Enterocloster lavalensis TaxID=460384 RepID=UPI000D1B4ABC|nr:ImmA/IrrE family metallo-endopeptidase [Enterocloster lavalensis]PST29773.1 hypothetical protein C7256_27815 [Enterocloster lavalensis]